MRLHADNGNRVGRTAELEPVFLRKQAKLRVLTFHELTEVRPHKVKESLKVLVLEHYAALESDASMKLKRLRATGNLGFFTGDCCPRSSLIRWSSPLANVHCFWTESRDEEAC